MVTDAPLPPTNYPSGDLRLLPDGSVLFILLSWREEGLLVHRVDHTGRTVLDYTYHKCAADVKYNPRAIAVCGNDYLVCAMEARAPQAGHNPGLRFVSLNTGAMHACSYDGAALKVR